MLIIQIIIFFRLTILRMNQLLQHELSLNRNEA